MRSQQEILQKIDGIAKILYKFDPKKDPFYHQYRILVHKLSWDNAKQFLRPEDITEEGQIEWEKLNGLDKRTLIDEIKEQCDIGAMHVTGQDIEYALFCACGLIALFWLLGPSKDKILGFIFNDFLSQESIYKCSEPVFTSVCNELGFNWERMKKCYTTGMFTRIEDKFGKKFRLEQDREIAQAIEETIDEKKQGKLAIEKDKEERGQNI